MFSKKYQEVINPYNEENASLYKGLMLKGTLDDSVVSIINKKNIESLYISFVSELPFDLSLLSQCKNLKEISVITGKIKGCEVFSVMPNIEKISISCEIKEVINFKNNIYLKYASFIWSDSVKDILNCNSVESLYVSKIKKIDFSFEKLVNLKHLDIRESKLNDLNLIKENKNLESLRLDENELYDIGEISNLKKLRKLIIRFSPKLTVIDSLAYLNDLEILVLDDIGCIESSPIHGLANLKALSLAGKTRISGGNLNFLENYRNLSMLSVASVKDYSHKSIRLWCWDDFGRSGLPLYERRKTP